MIQLREVAVRYPGQREDAIHDVSCEIAAGELVLCSGPTGSGKSTLGLTLCGAIPHVIPGTVRGEITIAGGSPVTRPVRESARVVGMVMQHVEWQQVTDRVDDEVAFGLENFAIPAAEMDARIEQALALTHAVHLRERTLVTLSSGERQRVMLAALCGLGQQVLLLDEPLAYLDAHGRTDCLALLARLAATEKAIIVFEHRRDLVRAVAHREITMHEGTLSTPGEAVNAYPALPARSDTDTPCLIAERVAVGYAQRSLMTGVSFRVHAGESVVLLGDNGTGKTSLFRAILGLLPLQAGLLTVCGHACAETPTARIARDVALVLQHPDHQLYLPTVREEVTVSAVDVGAAHDEMEALGLTALRERHPHALSMGQKRRVTLAAALARRPQVLLLDEPTIGQDDRHIALVLARLGRFVADGGALLTATHDERAAVALAHRAIHLSSGQARKLRAEQIPMVFHTPEPARSSI